MIYCEWSAKYYCFSVIHRFLLLLFVSFLISSFTFFVSVVGWLCKEKYGLRDAPMWAQEAVATAAAVTVIASCDKMFEKLLWSRSAWCFVNIAIMQATHTNQTVPPTSKPSSSISHSIVAFVRFYLFSFIHRIYFFSRQPVFLFNSILGHKRCDNNKIH